jgi:hypothetical protein
VRWSPDAAWEWYRWHPNPRGTNFVPSTAANWTEFWQEESFDRPTIARELRYAADIGLNTIRVFLPFIVWQADGAGLVARMHQLLELAHSRAISVVFCLFDDVSGKEPALGPQEVTPGVFSSAWTANPGPAAVLDRGRWPALRAYVTDVLEAFASDERVLFWDVYNEPGTGYLGGKSIPLLREAFEWARAADPKQPLTAAVYLDYAPGVHDENRVTELLEQEPQLAELAEVLPELNETMLELSDIVTFHVYGTVEATRAAIDGLARLGRPLICTEWMARTVGSTIPTHLPVFADHDPPVGSYMWGLVNGRMQTHISDPADPYHGIWYHDLFWPDGTPYDPRELEVLREFARISSGEEE